MYLVELIWNREFDWCPYGPHHPTIEDAVRHLRAAEDMGDGASVKSTRVIDTRTGETV